VNMRRKKWCRANSEHLYSCHIREIDVYLLFGWVIWFCTFYVVQTGIRSKLYTLIHEL
jgi:Na+/H+ antiporter NhaA